MLTQEKGGCSQLQSLDTEWRCCLKRNYFGLSICFRAPKADALQMLNVVCKWKAGIWKDGKNFLPYSGPWHRNYLCIFYHVTASQNIKAESGFSCSLFFLSNPWLCPKCCTGTWLPREKGGFRPQRGKRPLPWEVGVLALNSLWRAALLALS